MRSLLLSFLALALSGLVGAAMAAQSARPCVLVFGHGRNFEAGEDERNGLWDQLNLQFNQAVVKTLEAAGQPAAAMVFRTAAIDLEANRQLLLEAVQRYQCALVLESTVFVDPGALVLVARLRVHALSGTKGPHKDATLPVIGAAQYTSQRDFPFTQSVLDRLRPELLGQEMAQEIWQHIRSSQ